MNPIVPMRNLYLYSCLTLLVGLFSCKPSIDAPELRSGSANFNSVVYFGDTYLTGFQNGALYFEAQNKSLAAFIHGQLEEVESGPITQPFIEVGKSIGPNSKTWQSPYISRSHLHYIPACNGEIGFKPLKDLITTAEADYIENGDCQFTPTNVSVPFATSGELLSASTGAHVSSGGNVYYHYFATNPGTSTPLEDAVAQSPSFSVIWMGMENILRYGRSGGTNADSIIPPSVFEAELDTVLSSLSTSGGQGVIANLPDFRSLPYYTTIAYNGAVLNDNKRDSLNDLYHIGGANPHIQFVTGANGFIVGDPDAINGYRHLEEGEFITLSVPTDSLRCNFYGLLVNVIADQYALTHEEVAFMDQMIADYNTIIASKAVEYNIPMVDMNSYFTTLESGIVWDGKDLSMDFISGGFFSLDGVHPHDLGYSLIANEFIAAINLHYDAVIPPAYCADCEAVRFP